MMMVGTAYRIIIYWIQKAQIRVLEELPLDFQCHVQEGSKEQVKQSKTLERKELWPLLSRKALMDLEFDAIVGQIIHRLFDLNDDEWSTIAWFSADENDDVFEKDFDQWEEALNIYPSVKPIMTRLIHKLSAS